MDPNVDLMAKVHTRWAEVIEITCRSSSIPPAFLAALIANESGGDPNVTRFESGVLGSLWQVLTGRKTAYGSITRSDLYLFALPKEIPAIAGDLSEIATVFSGSFDNLGSLATSFGLTQIMGYHLLEGDLGISAISDLVKPQSSLLATLRLLAKFAKEFDLDLATEAASLFTCWNTGHPAGKTFDPEYTPNGLLRMHLYGSLPPTVLT